MGKKCFREVAGFDDRWIILIGLPLASIMISLLLFSDAITAGNWGYFTVCIPVSVVYTTLFWFGLRWAYHQVKSRYPAFQDLRKRLFWVSLAFLTIFFGINFILDKAFDILLPNLHKDGEPDRVVEFVGSLVLSALVITIYEAISFYIQLQQTVAEKAQLERQHVESQLEGLRNQVNPHFLFNSLNTLVYLIPEEPEKAVRFVQQLSKVYRYVLESREARLIPLRDELEYLHAYIFLLRERFGDNLRIELRDLDDSAEKAIVPLTLQLLFENAIKHNIISTEKPLTIEVFTQHDPTHGGGPATLIVRNNLQRKNQVMDSTGVGLENVRARYRMLTEQEIDVIVSPQYFTVVLPLLSAIPIAEHAIRNTDYGLRIAD